MVDEGSMEQYEDKDEDGQLNKRLKQLIFEFPIFFFVKTSAVNAI